MCWNIKDLEKQIPSVATINGMQVKGNLHVTSPHATPTCTSLYSPIF